VTAARLLDRLDAVKQTGPERWLARCPAHEDRTPSLSIRQTEDKILIYCHAGCHVEDILAAVNLSFQDLYLDTSAASYAAARTHGCREVKRMARVLDPLDHERFVLRIAREDLQAGVQHSLEDKARIMLALERVREEIAA
jgi:hypothetical protein